MAQPPDRRTSASASAAIARVGLLAARSLRGRGWFTRFPSLQRAYWRLLHMAGRQLVTVHGHSIELDPSDSLRLLARPEYEPAETSWYRSVIEPGHTVVEVGAHIGVFTNLFSTLVGNAGTVVALEPDPSTAEILQRNLERNGHTRVRVIQAAASDRNGNAAFFRSKVNSGDNRLFEHDEGDESQVTVRTVRLDDALADLPQIDLMKLDLQGGEPQAFAGMPLTFRDRPPRRILLEFWPQGLVGVGADPAKHLESLQRCGYDVSELLADGSVGPVSIPALVARLSPEGGEWVNLVAERSPA